MLKSLRVLSPPDSSTTPPHDTRKGLEKGRDKHVFYCIIQNSPYTSLNCFTKAVSPSHKLCPYLFAGGFISML